jgi:hypothetical protein
VDDRRRLEGPDRPALRRCRDWALQPTRLLEQPGTQATDTAKGQHPDVVVSGGRAFLYYFVHQSNEPRAKTDPYYGQRTVIQVAELKEAGGVLSVDREAHGRAGAGGAEDEMVRRTTLTLYIYKVKRPGA